MSKGIRIAAFLALFVLVTSAPVLANLGRAQAQPTVSSKTPAIAALAEPACVEPADYMRAKHMRLLDAWRDAVVREGLREYTSSKGRTYEISLGDTCLGCHTNREEFCDSCHSYTAVDPYCWECHDAVKDGA